MNPFLSEESIHNFLYSLSNSSSLVNLDISGLNLHHLNDTFFVPLHSTPLQTVNVAQNPLLSMSTHVLQPLQHLSSLLLSFCNLTSMPELTQSNALRELHVNNNLLSLIPADLPQTLQILDLNHNQIGEITKVRLSNLTQLKRLHLANNRISHV